MLFTDSGCTPDRRVELTVADNGQGLAQKEPGRDSLGLVLIRALTEQLHGRIDLDTQDGVRVKIIFPLD